MNNWFHPSLVVVNIEVYDLMLSSPKLILRKYDIDPLTVKIVSDTWVPRNNAVLIDDQGNMRVISLYRRTEREKLRLAIEELEYEIQKTWVWMMMVKFVEWMAKKLRR